MKQNTIVTMLAVALALAASLATGAGCKQSGKTWTVINREAGSGTRATFEEEVMTWTDAGGAKQGKALSLKSEQYMSNQGVLQAVATIDNGIGYVSLGYLPFEGVRTVTVDGTECTRETVFSGVYPMSRSLFFVTKGQASEPEKAFLYWCQN